MLLHATGLRGGRGRVYERLTEKASPRWGGSGQVSIVRDFLDDRA